MFWKTIWLTGLLATTVLIPAGCHRGYYRRMADAEAYRLVAEKNCDPRWDNLEGSITIDPQSRMFDPFSKDHPPLPPDDPTSHDLMHLVDGRKGYPHWHANGDVNVVASPDWEGYLMLNEQGELVIDFGRAIELALIHSPTYQRQREELYLSALDVALERFGFDSQLFAGYNAFFATEGRFRSGESRTTLSGSLGSTGGGNTFRKLGITGATFTVGLANSILWNFAGANTQTASSLLNFSVVQPLLRGAGRDRILESLTQAERTLLANVRQMERYRQGFNLEVTIGRSAGAGPNRGGGFLGLPTSATQNAGGVLGLLQTQQSIRIQEFNVQQLQDVVDQFNEFFNRERIDLLQVRQAETQLYSAQSQLLSQKVGYQNELDQFKRTLGLPPDVNLVIEDQFLSQFELITDSVLERLKSITALRRSTGDFINRIDEIMPATEEDVAVAGFQWHPELEDRIEGLIPALETAVQHCNEILTEERQSMNADIERMESIREDRLEYLEKLRERVAQGDIIADINPDILSDESLIPPESVRIQVDGGINAQGIQIEGIMPRVEKLKTELESLIAIIENLRAAKQQMQDVEYFNHIKSQILERTADQLTQLANHTAEISQIQGLTRSNSISLSPVDLHPVEALEIARCFRLDWMNARASLVDQWRRIEFVADQLESQVDFVFEGSMGNVGDNPFRIRYETGQLRGGFRLDAPIVRMAERNQYAETLIRYQQARRSYYQYEDEVYRNLRQTLRQIDLFRIQFELQRRNIRTALEQLENARFRIDQPVRAGAGSQLGNTTATDLTRSISQLQSTQLQFLNAWVSYEVLRRSLDYDLGTMLVDQQGIWLDPGIIDAEIGFRAAVQMGLDPTCLDCNLPILEQSPGTPPPPVDYQ